MLILEHDGKSLLAERGIPTPRGALARSPGDNGLPPSPCVVKAQVATGRRGKAGGVRFASTDAERDCALADILGMTIGGLSVRECRIEEAVAGREAYLSFAIEPAIGAVRILMSATGGIDVEADASIASDIAPAEPRALAESAARLAATLPGDVGRALTDAGVRLAPIFCELDLTLLEINPLFVLANGGWVAGDAKLAFDDNALERQPALRRLLAERGDAYRDAAFKSAEGFDFVVLDPQGEIGLVTTGAGLSMMLIDELKAQGARPFNFCDIRTGQMRGDPRRLIQVFEAMAAAANIRVVLVNIFAGITHLGEFAELLVKGRAAVPALAAPLVVRLVGNAEAEAAAILAQSGLAHVFEPDLDRAAALAVEITRRGRA